MVCHNAYQNKSGITDMYLFHQFFITMIMLHTIHRISYGGSR